MGTKNNPGVFDCYGAAEPDEPMFILLGRDPLAGELVRAWAMKRSAMGESGDKVMEAVNVATAMDKFAIEWRERKATMPVTIESLDE